MPRQDKLRENLEYYCNKVELPPSLIKKLTVNEQIIVEQLMKKYCIKGGNFIITIG